MPSFATSTSSLKLDHKLSKEELVRAIRLFIAAEYEAVQLYMQVAEATDDEFAKKVLTSVSDEEIVHAGEFCNVLYKLSPKDEKLHKEGYEEAGSSEKKSKESTPEDSKKERLKTLFNKE